MFTQLNVTIYKHSNGPSTGVEMWRVGLLRHVANIKTPWCCLILCCIFTFFNMRILVTHIFHNVRKAFETFTTSNNNKNVTQKIFNKHCAQFWCTVIFLTVQRKMPVFTRSSSRPNPMKPHHESHGPLIAKNRRHVNGRPLITYNLKYCPSQKSNLSKSEC